MGRTATGVKGIKLKNKDFVVSAAIINHEISQENLTVLTITEEGYGKRTKLSEYKGTIKRIGKGITNFKIGEKTGKVVDVKIVEENAQIMLITSEGTLIRTNVSDVSVIGRVTSGVRIMKG